ncbi:hypothetical protein HMI55_005716 [Coelomomyces lativittatus]|nr:hypothetical protein HMI55_005716 [Coelomomyces lativittatus]
MPPPSSSPNPNSIPPPSNVCTHHQVQVNLITTPTYAILTYPCCEHHVIFQQEGLSHCLSMASFQRIKETVFHPPPLLSTVVPELTSSFLSLHACLGQWFSTTGDWVLFFVKAQTKIMDDVYRIDQVHTVHFPSSWYPSLPHSSSSSSSSSFSSLSSSLSSTPHEITAPTTVPPSTATISSSFFDTPALPPPPLEKTVQASPLSTSSSLSLEEEEKEKNEDSSSVENTPPTSGTPSRSSTRSEGQSPRLLRLGTQTFQSWSAKVTKSMSLRHSIPSIKSWKETLEDKHPSEVVRFIQEMTVFLESGHFYYAEHTDLSRSLQLQSVAQHPSQWHWKTVLIYD